MTKGNFTKGEWEVQHSHSSVSWNVINKSIGNKFKIARCPYVRIEQIGEDHVQNRLNSLEAKANAQLCASAPKLLEMLSDMVAFMRDIDIPQPYFEAYGNLMMNAENVISEATNI